MTLGTTHSTLRYNGDGTTTVFAVTFEFHDVNDLEVIVVTRETGAEGLKSLGVDYSVAGGNGVTGTVTMTVAPTAAERLIVRRLSSDQQPDDLVDGGALAAEPLERRLDIITARLQELEADIARSLKVAKGSPATGLDLNLVGGRNRQLTVAADEQGVILATGTVPDNVVTSPFGETWVGLSGPLFGRANLELGTSAIVDTGTAGATIPLLDGNNTYSGTATFSADATFDSDLIVGAPFIFVGETLTINADGQIAPTKSSAFVNTFNSAEADNLDNIAVTNHPVGSVIKLQAGTSGQVPTVRHNGGGSGNVFLRANENVELDDRDKVLWLERRATGEGEHGAGWYEVGRTFSTPSEITRNWTRSSVSLTGTTVTLLTDAPTWVTDIEIDTVDLSFDATADPMLRIGPSGGVVSEGYDSMCHIFGSGLSRTENAAAFELTNSLISTSLFDIFIRLRKLGDTNIWRMTSQGHFLSGGSVVSTISSGTVTLTGALSEMELLPDLAANYSGGTAYVRYR